MSEPLDLDAITAYCGAATPEPWNTDRYPETVDAVLSKGGPVNIAACQFRRQDATFIARARTDLPAAVAELRKAREREEALKMLLADEEEGLVLALREAAWRVHIRSHSLRLTVQECGMPPCPATRALLEVK